MGFYTGIKGDMSDMVQKSLYLSEDGTQFSNQPYPITKELNRHLRFTNLTLKESYQLMLEGKSQSSKRVQKYVMENHNALIQK